MPICNLLQCQLFPLVRGIDELTLAIACSRLIRLASVIALFETENAMTCLPDLPHRVTRLVTIMMCVSAVWFSTSCDATNQHVTEPHTLAPPTKPPAKRFAPYEVLVKFKGGISQERIVSLLKESRTDVIAEIQRGRLYHVRILHDRSVEAVITQLASYPEVEYAEPNYRYETQK